MTIQHPMEEKPFKIYKSSAGSGKTYMLVLTYLSILLREKDAHHFRKVLAVTFTNKAAAEMKERVIQGLEKLISATDDKFVADYVSATQLSREEIGQRAREILTAILHDYSSFSILTIDKFVHRIIRSFSRELGLTTNFELETDHNAFYQRSIDQLLSTLGEDKQLTEFLVQYQQSLFEEERANSIENSLFELSKLLNQENSRELLSFYADKDLPYFIDIRKKTSVQIAQTKALLKETNDKVLDLFTAQGFDILEWKMGNTAMYAPFVKINKGETTNLLSDAQLKNFEAGTVTSEPLRKKNPQLVDFIETNASFILEQLKELQKIVRDLRFLEHIHHELVAFSLLNAIRTIFETLREENNLIFIKDFNEIISNVVQNEPTPFIYEKIGTRYHHILIDEFQDTSRMQWHNLVPLVYESLATRNTNLIVGDAKQAIYRFRGGDAQQFVDLPLVHAQLADIDHINATFEETQDLRNLAINYRSTPEIIDFNNWFFQELVLAKEDVPETIKEVYAGFAQHPHRTDSGLVQVTILTKPEKNTEEIITKQDLINERLMSNIQGCLADGFLPDDICILVRGQRDGDLVSSFLLEQGFSVVSVDSIILGNSSAVMDIIYHFKAIQHPVESSIAHCFLSTDPNAVTSLFEHYRIPNATNPQYSIGYRFDDYLTDYLAGYSAEEYHKLSLFDKVNYLITLKKYPRTDPYLDKLLNVAYDFMRMHGSNAELFLQHFFESAYKEKVNAKIAGGSIQLMTIHKSKGLQFPVVMIPYDFGGRISDKDLGLIGDERSVELGLPAISTKLKSAIKEWGFEDRLNEHVQEALLDDFNLYYVALTRPEKRLYLTIYTDEGIPARIKSLVTTHPKFDQEQQQLQIGTTTPQPAVDLLSPSFEVLPTTVSWREKLTLSPSKGYLEDEEIVAESEQDFGNYLHELISKNKHHNRLKEEALSYCQLKQLTDSTTKRLVDTAEQLMNDEQLNQWLAKANCVLRERDIITPEGNILRPDMLLMHNDCWILLDFKTGQPKKSHQKQVQQYGDVIAQLPQVSSKNLRVDKYLIYLSEEKIEYTHV
jgi:ATP-dependent exoDNAse (exonuclease V) beta subunit